MSEIVQNQYSSWQAENSAKFIYKGFIFVGEVDTDPQIEENQVRVYYIDENEQEVDLSQPIRTNSSGFPVISDTSSTVIQIRTDSDYSVKVLNKKGEKEWYIPKASTLNGVVTIDNITGLREELEKRSVNITYSEAQTENLGVNQYVTLIDRGYSLWIVSDSESGFSLPVGSLFLNLIDVDNFFAYGIQNIETDQHDLISQYATLSDSFYIPKEFELFVSQTVNVTATKINIEGSINALTGFTGTEVVNIGSFNAQQIGTLQSNVSEGFSTITIADTSSLSPGEVIAIYDPADFGWFASRDYYRKGEYVRVNEIISSTQFTGRSYLYDGYTTGTPVYKLNPTKIIVDCINVNASDECFYAVTYESIYDSVINGSSCTGGQVASVHRNRCYNVTFNTPSAQQNFDDGSVTNYAHYTLSCFGVVDMNPDVSALRHALTLTGREQVLSIPNRRCGAIGGKASNVTSQPGVTAVDFHANTEDCFYLDMEIQGGTNIGGKNNRVRSKIYQGSQVSCIYSADLKTAQHDYSGCEIETSLAGSSGRGQWINLEFQSNMEEGGLMDFSGLKVTCLGNPSAASDTIETVNNGYTGNDVRLSFDNMHYDGDSSLTNWITMQIGNVTAGSRLESVSIKGASLDYMACRITADNIYTDGYNSSDSRFLSNDYVGLDLRLGTGVLDMGDTTVKGTSLSPISVNGSLGAAAGVVVSSSINCLDGNREAGSTTEENSGFSVRSVDTAVLPSLTVDSGNVDPSATLSVRVNSVGSVVRGFWRFSGYSNSDWSGTSSTFDDLSLSQLKVSSSQFTTGSTLGTLTDAMNVYDNAGNLKGVIPIYDGIS